MGRLEELRQRFSEEPLVAFLGAELRELGDGRAVLVVPVKQEFLIVGGIVQGGIVTAVADYAGVYAAMTRIPSGHTPALHIGINFLRPVLMGDVMWAAARVENESKTTLVVSVEVFGTDNKRKATASIIFSKPRV